MADKKISQLTGATTPLAGTEELPIVQSGATTKVSVANLTAGRSISTAGASLDGAVTINESGADVDFRVEGDTEVNLLFVDASTNRVGIGTSTPGATLQVQKNGAGKQQIARFENINAATGHRLQISVNDDANSVHYQSTGATAGDHVFEGGSTEVVRILSGGGITFSGASADPNALDDYEEGTWTVTLYDASSSGNASATTVTGYYTKVGNLVTASFTALNNIDTTGMTAANALYFSLPFTASATGAACGSFMPNTWTFRAGAGSLIAPLIVNSATRGRFASVVSGGAPALQRVTELTSGTSDIDTLTITYMAA